MTRSSFLFLGGIVLGAFGVCWITPALSSSFGVAQTRDPGTPSASWTWRTSPTPPPLAASSAEAAISAWCALRSPEGGPASFIARAEQLRALLIRLPVALFPRLLDTFGDQKLGAAEFALRQLAFTHWTDLDPAAAARWAAARPDRRELVRDALRAWSARDARAAAAWVCALPDDKALLSLAPEPLRMLAEHDAPGAVALLSARGERVLKALLPALMPILARRDPAAAVLAYAPRVWDRGMGASALRPALSAWLAADPSAALAWLIAQPRARGIRFSNFIGAHSLTRGQHTAVADALATLPDIPERQATLADLLYVWAGADSASAIAWLDQLHDPALRAILLEHAVSTTNYERSPVNQLPLALALPPGEKRDEHIGTLLFDWSQKDPGSALRWIDAHASDPSVAAIAFGAQASALGAIARDEPATALAEWQALPAGPLKIMAIATIAEAWGRAHPGEAIRWQEDQAKALGVPISTTREQIFNWARQDASSALRWAETRQGPFQRFALDGLVADNRNRAAPAVAAELYSQINDPALRAEYVSREVRAWLAKDRAGAKAWLESHDALTPAQAAALLTATP